MGKQKVLWFTDTHLFFWNRKKILKEIISHNPDGIFFTGDISQSAYTLIKDLEYLFSKITVPIYLILGNHCRWGGSIENINEKLRELSKKYINFHWLTEEEPLFLNDNTTIIGADGFYDARFGNNKYIKLTLDWVLIKEIRQIKGWQGKLDKFREIADNATRIIINNLEKALKISDTIYVLTHVSPFENTVQRDLWINKEYYESYDVNSYLGEELKRVMKDNKDKKVIVICGHSHYEINVQIDLNIECKVGRGAYHSLNENEILFI